MTTPEQREPVTPTEPDIVEVLRGLGYALVEGRSVIVSPDVTLPNRTITLIEQLRAEVERLQDGLDFLDKHSEGLEFENTEIKRERDRYREALRKYGEHLGGDVSYQGGTVPMYCEALLNDGKCTCGLDESLAEKGE